MLAVPTARSTLAFWVQESHTDITVTSSLKASAQWWAAVCWMGYLALLGKERRTALKRSRPSVGLDTSDNSRWFHQNKHTGVFYRAYSSWSPITNEIQHKGRCHRWLVLGNGFVRRFFSLEMLRGSSESLMEEEKVNRKRCVHSFSQKQNKGCLYKLLSGRLWKNSRMFLFNLCMWLVFND